MRVVDGLYILLALLALPLIFMALRARMFRLFYTGKWNDEFWRKDWASVKRQFIALGGVVVLFFIGWLIHALFDRSFATLLLFGPISPNSSSPGPKGPGDPSSCDGRAQNFVTCSNRSSHLGFSAMMRLTL